MRFVLTLLCLLLAGFIYMKNRDIAILKQELADAQEQVASLEEKLKSVTSSKTPSWMTDPSQSGSTLRAGQPSSTAIPAQPSGKSGSWMWDANQSMSTIERGRASKQR